MTLPSKPNCVRRPELQSLFFCPETLLLSLWAPSLCAGMNVRLATCFLLLKDNNPVTHVVILRNVSSFYCCLHQKGESNTSSSIMTGTGCQEIYFFKGINLENHYAFPISSCSARLHIKSLLLHTLTKIQITSCIFLASAKSQESSIFL